MPTTAFYPVKISSGEYVWTERTAVDRRNAMRRMLEKAAQNAAEQRPSTFERVKRMFTNA